MPSIVGAAALVRWFVVSVVDDGRRTEIMLLYLLRKL